MILNDLKKVMVIGGSGFVGTRLAKRLSTKKDIELQIFDKNPSNLFNHLVKRGDIRITKDLSDAMPDGAVLIHLAAEHRDDVTPISLYSEVNVNGAKNICLVAEEKNIETIVFTSTVAVYGFAPLGTSEAGEISPFNEYGRTKYEAEKIFLSWQNKSPNKRVLVIVRPTVIFGEKNRGNVYNLLRQIQSGRFMMVGNGENRKSMAYVENVAAFLEHGLTFTPGVHVYNYVDKPDLSMNELVAYVSKTLGQNKVLGIKLPLIVGLLIGKCFDVLSKVIGRKFTVSFIRVKKFSANSVFDTAVAKTNFVPPVKLYDGFKSTLSYEFLESNSDTDVYYSE